MQPLKGIRVLDFSTLLPGPLATLMLAEAGAEVIKIERPGRGDEMRSYTPKFGSDSVNFALLNRGKRSIAIDLKAAGAVDKLKPLLEMADVVVEQFRPGVMDRLGLGYEALRALNPRIVYCAITGYGQRGPRADAAAHDLNYVAEAGMLALTKGADGAPVLPAALVADIAGGTYPAVVNILLALRERDRSGVGCKLDIAMADNLFTLMYWGIGNGLAAGEWPKAGGDLVTGGSPRYNIYRTLDGRFLAAAPLEQKFWDTFCELLEVPAHLRDDAENPEATRAAVAERVQARTADALQALFTGHDVCCTIATTLDNALRDAHFVERGIFARKLAARGQSITALPVPVVDAFRSEELEQSYPALGEANDMLDSSRDRLTADGSQRTSGT
jgi:crotonobetainyl-CoA:carnitine CoA-transferase CaiB-like acyl-CoA transferase